MSLLLGTKAGGALTVTAESKSLNQEHGGAGGEGVKGHLNHVTCYSLFKSRSHG